MKTKLAVAMVVLFFASVARADSTSEYTITFNEIAESSRSSPSPTFGPGHILSDPFEEIMEFDFSADTGIVAGIQGIPEWNLAAMRPIYLCDGCNILASNGNYTPLILGWQSSEVLFFASADPTLETGIIGQFPSSEDYYAFGKLSFTPLPANTPEPSTILLSGIAVVALIGLARCNRKKDQIRGPFKLEANRGPFASGFRDCSRLPYPSCLSTDVSGSLCAYSARARSAKDRYVENDGSALVRDRFARATLCCSNARQF